MRNIIFNLKLLLNLLVLTIMLILMGCQSTTMPESSRRKITVYAYELDSAGNCTDKPISGVKIYAYDPAKPDTVDKEITDNNGTGVLEFDAPNVGHEFHIISKFSKFCNNKTFTDVRQDLIYPCCKDTTLKLCFDPGCGSIIECTELRDTTINVKFTDNNSECIYQTSGSRPVQRLIQLPYSSKLPIIVTWLQPENYSPPFILNSPKVTKLNPNEPLLLSFSINANNPVGKYEKQLKIKLQCTDDNGGLHSGIITINLIAEICELNCDSCLTKVYDPQKGEIISNVVTKSNEAIHANEIKDYTKVEVFKNTFESCIYIIDTVYFKLNSDQNNWAILGWDRNPITFGNSFLVDFRFNPKTPGPKETIIFIEYHNQNGVKCQMYVKLVNYCCEDICPSIQATDYINKKPFDSTEKPITLSNKLNGRFGFSQIDICDNTKSSKSIIFNISYDQYACQKSTDIRIAVEDKESYKFASKYFSIENSGGFTLNSPGSNNIKVTFTAPTIKEFNDVVLSKRGDNRRTEDSTFTIYLTISSNVPGCQKQKIKISAILGNMPNGIGIQTIWAYNQLSVYVPKQYQQVCFFDGVDVGGKTTTEWVVSLPTIHDNQLQPYPPKEGDFYIDAKDNSATTTTPREPIIKLCDTSNMKNIKYWKQMTENDLNNYENVQKIVMNAYFDGSLKFDSGLKEVGGIANTNDFNKTLKNEATYILWTDTNENGIPCDIALVNVRGIFRGTEDNAFKLSGILFRVVNHIRF